MNTRSKSRRAWAGVRKKLEDGSTASVPKTKFPHPLDAGAQRTSTWPVGQVADFSIPGRPGQAPVVVREHDDRFDAFLEGACLTKAAVDAAEANPTMAMYMGGALFGGAVGASITNRREGTLVGAGLGLLFAVMLDAGLASKQRR